MSRRLFVLTTVPLALLGAAGCTAATGTATPTASATATSATTASATASATTAPTPAGTPSSAAPGGGAAATTAAAGTGSGTATGLDVEAAVRPCPNDGQDVEIQKVVTGDVTGDGVRDTLVARTCEAVTSYWPSTVEIFDGSAPASRPRRVATLLTDAGPTDQPWVTAVKVVGGDVEIKAYGVGAHTDNACLKYTFTYRFHRSGDTFRQTLRQVGRLGYCPRIG